MKKVEKKVETDFLGNYYGMPMWGNNVTQAYIADLKEDLRVSKRSHKVMYHTLLGVTITLTISAILLVWR